MSINTRLKELRKELKVNQEEFATTLHMKQNSITQMETGRRNLSDRTILEICDKFNVNETWLRNNEGDMFKPKKMYKDTLTGHLGKLEDDVQSGAISPEQAKLKEWLAIRIVKMSGDQLDVIHELFKEYAEAFPENLDKKKDED